MESECKQRESAFPYAYFYFYKINKKISIINNYNE